MPACVCCFLRWFAFLLHFAITKLENENHPMYWYLNPLLHRISRVFHQPHHCLNYHGWIANSVLVVGLFFWVNLMNCVVSSSSSSSSFLFGSISSPYTSFSCSSTVWFEISVSCPDPILACVTKGNSLSGETTRLLPDGSSSFPRMSYLRSLLCDLIEVLSGFFHYANRRNVRFQTVIGRRFFGVFWNADCDVLFVNPPSVGVGFSKTLFVGLIGCFFKIDLVGFLGYTTTEGSSGLLKCSFLSFAFTSPSSFLLCCSASFARLSWFVLTRSLEGFSCSFWLWLCRLESLWGRCTFSPHFRLCKWIVQFFCSVDPTLDPTENQFDKFDWNPNGLIRQMELREL